MIKKILKHFFINSLALYFVAQGTEGLVFAKGLETVLLAGAGLTIASLLVRPVINILLLPINLVTFNLFKWVSSAIALYLVTLVVPGFKISHFFFEGLTTKWIDLPQISFSGALAYVAFAFVISFATSLIHWFL